MIVYYSVNFCKMSFNCCTEFRLVVLNEVRLTKLLYVFLQYCANENIDHYSHCKNYVKCRA